METLKTKIRHVPDFPKPGILFYDVTTLLQDPAGFREAIDHLAAPFVGKDIDIVVGIESRGFIFGSAVADRLGAGFSPVRKPGKLPHHTESVSYALEYGENALEVHVDALGHGHRVLLVDDLIATGGTAAASCALVERLGGSVVGCSFLIELDALEGRKALHGQRVHSVLHF